MLLQGERMDARIVPSQSRLLPIASLNFVKMAVITVLIPVLDRVIYPLMDNLDRKPTLLQRIGQSVVTACRLLGLCASFANTCSCYSAPVWKRSIAISLSVCLCVCGWVYVCLPASISLEPLDRTSRNFCADLLWLWLGRPLAALRYVMYFRFYE